MSANVGAIVSEQWRKQSCISMLQTGPLCKKKMLLTCGDLHIKVLKYLLSQKDLLFSLALQV